MKINGFELDHIGVAVESLASGKGFYEALGLGPMTVEEVPSEKVRVGFFELENEARIELLEPMDADSPIAKFLGKRGPGIHHICLRVSDIRAAIQSLKASGAQMINEEPRPGAHGCQVAFVHPKSTGGILLELSQPAEAKK
ncbi:MAG: methylmalonyl-CoA epimerase [Bdellovibrionales bacterium]